MSHAAAVPQVSLEVIEPDTARRVVNVTTFPFLIGRGAEEGNHVQLADKRVSRRCIELRCVEGNIAVVDRGQRQGVFVNGEKVENERAIRDGDIITFGSADSLQLIFHAGDAQAQESLPDLLSRLDNLSSLERGARDMRQLSLLLEATALLQSRLPMEDLLAAMVDRAIEITDADRGLLLESLPDGTLRAMVARQRGSIPLPSAAISPSQTVIKHALQLQHGLVEQDLTQAASALRAAASVVLQGLRQVAAIPLFSLGQVRSNEAVSMVSQRSLLGVLYLDSRHTAAFSNLQRQILDALALEAASVLDNARLLQRERERRRLEQELSIARDIQQALLPRGFEQFPYLQVTGINRSCLAVGGDYYDLFPMSADRTAFVITDVCGKGLGAALLTAMLQGAFASLTLGQEIAPFFAHVNRFICSHSDVQKYATMFFGTLDATGRMEFVNAGHVPPLLVRRGEVSIAFEEGCMPVGLLPTAQFSTCTSQLEPGDVLVLMTDGVPEAMSPDNEQFGNDRLLEAARKYANGTVEELQGGILSAVEEFTRGAYQSDDITLLTIRYQP